MVFVKLVKVIKLEELSTFKLAIMPAVLFLKRVKYNWSLKTSTVDFEKTILFVPAFSFSTSVIAYVELLIPTIQPNWY